MFEIIGYNLSALAGFWVPMLVFGALTVLGAWVERRYDKARYVGDDGLRAFLDAAHARQLHVRLSVEDHLHPDNVFPYGGPDHAAALKQWNKKQVRA